MKIDFAMLTAKDLLKIQLLTYIRDQAGEFSLTDFATMADVSYSRAYHVLLNLRSDLLVLDQQTVLTKDLLTTRVTMDDYRHWLYRQSVPYLAMRATLTGEYQQTSDFCAAHEISLSTFNRRMRPMKHELAQYNLQLSASPLRLVGNETLIQLLYFMLFTTTLTPVTELPVVPTQLQVLHQQLVKTYTQSGLYQDAVSLQQRRDLMITLALLRLAQGHRYPALRLPLVHLTDLRELAGQFQTRLGDSPQQALTELATLDYLLTSSPYFVRALQPKAMARLYRGLRHRNGRYQLAPGVAELADFAQGDDWFANWLFSLCQFMLLFRVDPLLRPEITALYQPTPSSSAAALVMAENMGLLYPQQVGKMDLRMVQKYLSKYTNGLTLTAAKVEILVTYDMIGVTTDIFNRLLSGIVHLSLLTDQTTIDPQHRDNYIVVYGVDPRAEAYARREKLEIFHWVKELPYGENLDRLIRKLRHHELSLFALDFNNHSHPEDED
ncbi:helix-turn-helix domain-containing protein [Levilactobacillus angrenensis]|uniref:Helix-turn-helix domain-containing protein n=1 Tax=Levilactobacillus angrenensis TaxID=2486020 RepID=A0ABW1UAE5_9LACO|nr:helix-turn-helix domain-containing protein [Levilactobacillus angrenensis]